MTLCVTSQPNFLQNSIFVFLLSSLFSFLFPLSSSAPKTARPRKPTGLKSHLLFFFFSLSLSSTLHFHHIRPLSSMASLFLFFLLSFLKRVGAKVKLILYCFPYFFFINKEIRRKTLGARAQGASCAGRERCYVC